MWGERPREPNCQLADPQTPRLRQTGDGDLGFGIHTVNKKKLLSVTERYSALEGSRNRLIRFKWAARLLARGFIFHNSSSSSALGRMVNLWSRRFIAQPSNNRKSVREKLAGHLQVAQAE